jgi:hypothetical protein
MHTKQTFAGLAFVEIETYGLADLFGDGTSIHDPFAASASMQFPAYFCKIRATMDLVATHLEGE